MPAISGFVDNTTQFAHRQLIQTIHDFALANDWEVMRFVNTGANHEVILKGSGFTETDEIYVGFRSYESVPNDYYNIECAVFTGYLPAETFQNQPGRYTSSICAHNQRIDYWINLNARRITGFLKVGTPVYEPFYVGGFLPYGLPTQYPYPVVVSGTLNGSPALRFSTANGATHQMGLAGARPQLGMRFNTGVWLNPNCAPWSNVNLTGATNFLRDTNGYYPLTPIVLWDANGAYGELEGIYHVSGFDNVVENTINSGEYVIGQNITNTNFSSYYALSME